MSCSRRRTCAGSIVTMSVGGQTGWQTGTVTSTSMAGSGWVIEAGGRMTPTLEWIDNGRWDRARVSTVARQTD